MKTQMKFGLKDKKKIIAVLVAVIMMGLSLAFLIKVDFGTDPCTSMNLGFANKLGLSFGNWLATFNILLLMVVIVFDRSQLGWGTVANMFLVGYCTDFFTWVLDQLIPTDIFSIFWIRVLILIPSLALFILAAAVYMTVGLGSAPYDATLFIISSKIKSVPFRIVRMAWDIAASLIGLLLGSTIGIVTVVIAFALGPVISWVQGKLTRFL